MKSSNAPRPGKFLLVIFLLAFGARGLFAEDEPKEIRTKSRDLEKIKTELNRKREEKERLKQEAEQLSGELQRAKAKMQDAEEAIDNTRLKTREVEQQLAVSKNAHDRVASSLEDETARFHDQLGRYQVAALIEGPDGLTPVYSRFVLHAQAGRVRDLSAKNEDTQHALSSLVETERVVRTELDRQQGNLTDIRSGNQERERDLSKKMTRQEQLDSELKDLQKNAAELASLIDNMRSRTREEQDKERQSRLQKQASGQSPIAGKSLPWPVSGHVVTTFGRHVNPTSGATVLSNGVVIASEAGQEVKAVATGQVIYAGEFMSYGSMVVLEHPGDWYTVYGQLGSWKVEKGQEMQVGEIIGTSRPRSNGGGETYFELRFYGKPTDPLPWLVAP